MPPKGQFSICTVVDCDRRAAGRGLCGKHWSRWRRHGDPLVNNWAKPQPFIPRLVENSDMQDDGCWLWLGFTDEYGYGRIRSVDRNHPVHRIAYTLIVGPTPDGLELDHLCRVRNCWRPDHLEPVTHAENVRRAWVIRKATKESA